MSINTASKGWSVYRRTLLQVSKSITNIGTLSSGISIIRIRCDNYNYNYKYKYNYKFKFKCKHKYK